MGVVVDSFNNMTGSSRVEDVSSNSHAYCRGIYASSATQVYIIIIYSDLGTMLLGRIDYSTSLIYYTELLIFSQLGNNLLHGHFVSPTQYYFVG
jgi:hypothetical protein